MSIPPPTSPGDVTTIWEPCGACWGQREIWRPCEASGRLRRTMCDCCLGVGQRAVIAPR